MAIDLLFDVNEIPLLTDLYELTMAASYFRWDSTEAHVLI